MLWALDFSMRLFMNRILIWKKVTPGSEYDLFHTVSNHEQIQLAINNGTYNFGNRLWLQGLMSAIDNGENKYTFLDDSFSSDYINENFDLIIYPMANIFNKSYLHYIKSSAEQIENIRIPTFVIACGAQAETYEQLEELIKAIGDESKRFIEAIYKTGGEFALRGHFTKEFFLRLGYNSAVVTGCPSLYQMGRDFSIDNRKKAICENPAFNGSFSLISKLLDIYHNCLYYDQDLCLHQLYNPNLETKTDFKSLLAFYCNCGPEMAHLLSKDLIRLYPEMSDWRNSMINHNIDYSFGSRIHGNIMAILSGIPATVVAIDSRTREMAEFYEIPYVLSKGKKVFTYDEFLDCYRNADYSNFNTNYASKFDAFEKFLIDNKIVTSINSNNKFFNKTDMFEPLSSCNTEKFKKLSAKLDQNRHFLALLKKLL